MSDRIQQTWQLLASIADWEPGPAAATARGALPGELGAISTPCPACDGTGRLKSLAACRHCHGRGTVTLDPQTRLEAPAAPDPNDYHVTPADLARSIRWRRVRCDRCAGKPSPTRGCPGCAGTGMVDTIDTRLEEASLARTQREWGGDPVPPDWWLSAALERKRALFRTGSYPELQDALDALRRKSPAAFTLIDVHVIHPQGIRMGPRRQRHLDAIVAWLTERMPTPIQVPDHARTWSPVKREMLWRGRTEWHDRQREQRDRELRELHQAGVPVDELQRLSGLSRARVYDVVRVPVATVAA